MNTTLTTLSLLSAVILSGCAAAPDQMSSTSSEICDVKEPVLGSRVSEKVRCAPPKKAGAQPAG